MQNMYIFEFIVKEFTHKNVGLRFVVYFLEMFDVYKQNTSVDLPWVLKVI